MIEQRRQAAMAAIDADEAAALKRLYTENDDDEELTRARRIEALRRAHAEAMKRIETDEKAFSIRLTAEYERRKASLAAEMLKRSTAEKERYEEALRELGAKPLGRPAKMSRTG